MNQRDMQLIIDIFNQKIFELEEDQERYGGYNQVLDAQKDIVNDLMKDVQERFKYKL